MLLQRLTRPFRNLIPVLFLLSFSNLFAQWETVKENGCREFLHLAKAGGKTIAVSIDGKVFYSLDKGLSWQEMNFPNDLVDAFSKTEKCAGKAGFLYFPFSVSDGSGITSLFLLRSNDDGASWQKLPLSNSYVYNVFSYPDGVIIVQSNGVFRLRDDSNDAQQIAAAGNESTKFYYTNNRLWRFQGGGSSYSTDEGSTWIPVSPGGLGADLAVKGDTVCIVNDTYGIYRSIDAGLSWQTVYSQQTGAYFKIHADENGFYRYYYNDIAIDRSVDGFASWSPMLNTAFQARQMVWQDGAYIVVTARGMLRSEDTGGSWSWIYDGITPAAYQGDYFLLGAADMLVSGRTALSTDGGTSWVGAPILPLLQSLLTKNNNYYAPTLYNGVYRTNGTDISNWYKAGTPPNASPNVQIVAGELVCVTDGWLYRSPDEGVSWEQISYLNVPEFRVFLDDSLYKVKNSYSFFYSGNLGLDWEQRGNFPVSPGNDFSKIHFRSFDGVYYLLWREGVMVSEDRGYTWTNHPHKFFDPNGNIQFQGFVINNAGMVVHWDNRIWLSPDRGRNWIAINENLPHQRYGSLVWANDALFVADYNGNIWKRTNFDFTFNTLFGTVFIDGNNNGQFDSQEPRLPGIALGTSLGQGAAISDGFGKYALFYGIVPDTLKPVPPSVYTTVIPPYHVIANGDTIQDFAVQVEPDKQDLSLILTQATSFVPGFDNTLTIRVNNPGTNTTDGELMLVLDDDLQFLSASPAPFQIIGNTLFWYISLLNPLGFADIKVSVRTTASVPVNTAIELTATVEEINGAADLTPADNSTGINTFVVSSFDPNDKQVSPAVYNMDSLVQLVPLDYTIRFQNTGNFQASFVYILDTLAPGLDFSTFKLMASSHPVTVSARYGKVVEFFFNNINLPDSSSDEQKSHGFVRYSIVPGSQLGAGSIIPNTAYIYFDYNTPVRTNTVTTMIGTVNVVESSVRSVLSILPNPSSGWVKLKKDDNTDGLLTVLNDTGSLVLQTTTTGSEINLDCNALADGLYALAWQTAEGVYVGKVVLIKK